MRLSVAAALLVLAAGGPAGVRALVPPVLRRGTFSAASSRAPLPVSSRPPPGRRGSASSLHMMFDRLASGLSTAVENAFPSKNITEKGIKSALREVRRNLLDADVNVEVADSLIAGVRSRVLGSAVAAGVSPDQQFVKAMYDELLDLMGGDPLAGRGSAPAATLARKSGDRPAVVLLAGLQGAGKTTAAGKLALYLKEREVDYDSAPSAEEEGAEEAIRLASRMEPVRRKVLLVAADVYRPAAISQLKILGEQVGVDVFDMGTDADPVEICVAAVAKATAEGYDTVLVDTAGRQVIDANLMGELKNIQAAVTPDETLLVVDAMTGQEAATLTASFDAAVGLTGAILTKLDGDSRGGAAVSVRAVSGRPIKFVGTGEKVEDLEPFYPDRMAGRILGMGDVVSLVEKAAAEVSDAEAERMTAKMKDASFDFDDFLSQTQLISKMGSFAGVAKMIPGVSGMMDSSKMNDVEARLARSCNMVKSMTKKEKQNPELLIKDRTARNRLRRIAEGSGNTLESAMQFVSEFQKMRTMMSRMQKQMDQGGASGMDGESLPAGPEMGNRMERRVKKKKKKVGGGGGRGFG